jgi:hypothetical protein
MDAEEVMNKESEQRLKEQRMMQKLKKQEKRAKPNSKGDPGRPINTGAPQEKERETKPQGMAWILGYERQKTLAVPFVAAVEKNVAKQVLRVLGKKTMRSLTKHEARGIEEITFAVAAQLFGVSKVTNEMVLSVLKSNPTIDGKIYALYCDIRTPEMLKQDRMVAMASAIALHKVQGE